MDLTLNELQTFGAVADALLPSLPGPGFFWTSSGSALVRNRLPTLFSGLPNDRARNDLRRLLRMLDTGIGGLLLYGRPRRFADLALDERESVLRRMATSRSSLSRQAFQVLKRLAGILAVTTAEGESFNPVWSDIGYPGPFGPPPRVAKPLNPVRITTPSVWQCDVVVVGSGDGGGAAAGVLAAAGLDVVVLEKGRYLNASDFTHLESEAYRDLYLDNQLASTADLGIGFFAGSCLGGGTVLGYTTSFATPQHVRKEWDRIAGFSGVFTGSEYETALSAVFARLRINTDHSKPSPQEALMEAGLRARGWHAAPTARNAVGCSQDEECGFCTMGCRRQARQSAQLTWLQDAAEAGTRIIVEAEVMKVVTERGKAVGVEALIRGIPLSVRARAVVVACGTLHTPALLKRSGLGGPAAGRFFRIHPTTAVWGRFPDREVRPWSGTIQAMYSDEFSALDGEGYGCTYEEGPVHPVLMVQAFGWGGGRQYKEHLLQYRHWSHIGVRLRDRDAGRVDVSRKGLPVAHYSLSRRDQAHLRIGILRAAEVLASAGAEEVMTTTAVPVTWRPASREPLESFMRRVDTLGYGPNQMLYGSYHQMGTARMGSDPKRSVVDPENQAHGMSGLFVMDASCFPTSSGVNPHVSVGAIAYRGAKALARKLKV